MGFFAAIKSCYAKIFTISGRASPSEYWWFVLFQFLASIAASVGLAAFLSSNPDLMTQLKYNAAMQQDAMIFCAVLSTAGFLLLTLPGLTSLVRRLHDTDRSGWWYWISLVPVIGAIWLLVLLCLPGNNGRNTYGPDPLGARRRLNDHPALMGDMDPEVKAALRERQQADFKDYYRSRVLPQIQQNKAARGV